MPEVERLVINVDVNDKGVARTLTKIDAQIDAVSRDRTAEIHVNIDDKDLVKAKATMAGLDASTINAASSFQALGGALSMLKIPVMINAVALAAQGIMALGGATVALTDALVPLTGLLATAPQQILALGAAGITGFAAVKSVTGAITAQSAVAKEASKANRDAYAQSLAGLTDEAKKFVTSLPPLMAQVKTFGSAIGAGVFEGINEFMAEGPKKIMESLRPVLYQTGQALGQVVNSLGQNLAAPEFLDKIVALMRANIPLLKQFGEGVGNIIQGLTNLATTAAPLTDFFGDWATGLTETFKNWAESDDLSGFFERSAATTTQLTTILGDLWQVLRNVGQAARPLGEWLMDAFENSTRSLKELTGSAAGMERMTAYFDSLKPALSEFAGLLKDVAKIFVDLGANATLASFIATVRKDLIPVLAEFHRTTSQMLSESVVKAVAGLGKVFVELASSSTGLIGLVNIVGGLASALGVLLERIPGLRSIVIALLAFKTAATALKIVGLGGVVARISQTMMGAEGATKGLTYAFSKLGEQWRGNNRSLGNLASTFTTSIGKFQGLALAAAGVAAAALLMKDAWEKARNSHESFVSSMDDFAQTHSGNGSEGYDYIVANIEGNIDRLQAKLDKGLSFEGWLNGDNLRVAATWLTRNTQADEDNKRVAEEEKQRAQQAKTLIGDLTKEFNVSDATANRFVRTLYMNGEALDYNAQMAQRFKDSLSEANSEAARTQAISKWTGTLGMSEVLNTEDLQREFFSDDMIATLDSMEVATNAYNDALANTQSLEAELASAQGARVGALKSYESALKGLTSANKSLANAEKALAEARKGASALELAQADLSHRRTLIEQKRSVEDLRLLYIDLAKATQQAAKQIDLVSDEFTGKTYEVVRLTGGEQTQRDIVERARAVEDAKLRIEQANLAVQQSEESLAELYKQGTEQDERVIAAKEAVTAALEAVNEAQLVVAGSAEELGRADAEVARIAGELSYAQDILTAATEAAQVAQEAAYRAIADAGQRMGIDVTNALSYVAAALEPNAALRKLIAETAADFSRLAQTATESMWLVADVAMTKEQAVSRGVGTRYRLAPLSNNRYIPDGGGDWIVTPQGQLFNLVSQERRALGGPVQKGSPYLVGERRPEIFVPTTDGYIKPAASRAQETGGMVINNTFNEKVDPMLVGKAIAWELS